MIQLPLSITSNNILTPDQLRLLQDVFELPTLDPLYEDEVLKNIIQYYSLSPEEMDNEIRRYAGELLNKGKIKEAWQVLLTISIM